MICVLRTPVGSRSEQSLRGESTLLQLTAGDTGRGGEAVGVALEDLAIAELHNNPALVGGVRSEIFDESFEILRAAETGCSRRLPVQLEGFIPEDAAGILSDEKLGLVPIAGDVVENDLVVRLMKLVFGNEFEFASGVIPRIKMEPVVVAAATDDLGASVASSADSCCWRTSHQLPVDSMVCRVQVWVVALNSNL